MARQVLENGVILPAEYSDDWYDDMTSNLTKLDDVIGSDSEKLSSADVGAAALSNNYNDLDNLPTIPTVNDATLTIQKNGVDVQTFTANASSNVTANITVPTKTSDLTNDSNFVDTSNSAVASGITSAKVTDYDAHIADTDIHVTTADKNKWNNNTYVFRYSSTALVASSTNSNTLLDNTDNLKVGDKVIDSSGVLFSITAIDTANSTFTIGTALIDLAQDSDVVHKSGNETVDGQKTFSHIQTGVGRDLYHFASSPYSKNTPPANISFQYIWFIGNSASQGLTNNWYGGYIEHRVYPNGSAQGRWFVRDTSESGLGIELFINGNDKQFRPQGNNITDLGTPTNKWKSFNGLEPSSLSLPSDRSARIDISSYFTNTGTGNTNDYSVPANGYIFLNLLNAFAVICYSIDGTNNVNYAQSYFRPVDGQIYILFPVRKNDTFRTLWTANGGTITVTGAHFIPCQGNV